MKMPRESSKPPLSPAHLELGRFLRKLRKYRGLTTRDMEFSSSTISTTENGLTCVTRDVLSAYSYLCYGDEKLGKELNRLYWAMIEAHMDRENRRKNKLRTRERRESLMADMRLVMRKIEAEILGFSEQTRALWEGMDARIIERLAKDDERLRQRLKEAGIPKDWQSRLH